MVSGTFVAPPNSGITVNGVVAAVRGGNFYADVPLVAGSNTLTATLTTPGGSAATQSITVSSDGVTSIVRIAPDALEGVAPFTATFAITNPGPTDVTIASSGGGIYSVPAGGEMTLTWSLSVAGSSPVAFTVTDALGQASTTDYVLVAQDAAQLDQLLASTWSAMNDALIAGDKVTAMKSLSGPAQEKFGPVFDLLMPNYAQIVASFSPLQRGSLSADIGEYVINRTINGVDHAFFIYFLRGPDGRWRLDSM
jgi:hypothetical protein